MTDDGGQRTEGRGRRADDGGWRAGKRKEGRGNDPRITPVPSPGATGQAQISANSFSHAPVRFSGATG